MSAVVVVRELGADHGARELFRGLSFTAGPGDVVGPVGPNGAGKTTLLRILAGERRPDSGTVTRTPPSATCGYLPQQPQFHSGESVLEFLSRRTGVAAARAGLDAATAALAGGERGAEEVYAAALDRWLALGGADLDERAPAVLAELGLPVGPSRLGTALSGGQAARLSLAALLLSRFDLLLLDEPTNDLDLAGLERLERFVTGSRVAVVLVSHDREFLSRTVTTVVELDSAQRRVGVYGGGYQGYLAERERVAEQARSAYEEYEEHRRDLTDRARRQRDWAERGVRNARRNADDTDKITRRHQIASSEKQGAKARATEQRLARLEPVAEPRREWQLRLSIAAAPRPGAVVATLRRAVVRRGEFTLGPVDLQIDSGDRVAITGANGSGKSTLLAALLGRLPLERGSAGLGPSVVVGEIDQAREAFTGGGTLLAALGDQLPDQAPGEIRTLLAKFGLGADHVLRPAATLSPGERTRAALALLQARGVNLLVLDEPTNHLDLPAIEQLERALAGYPGTLLLVTHDRRMLESVRVNRTFTVDGGTVRQR